MVSTEQTPNPDTLKFLPGKKVSEIGPVQFMKNEKNTKNVSLAKNILSLEGTEMVFFGEDFITVKKKKNLKQIMTPFLRKLVVSRIDLKLLIYYQFMQV